MIKEEFTAIIAACGLSQRQAAAYFGVSDRTVRHWVSGRNKIPMGVSEGVYCIDNAIQELAEMIIEGAGQLGGGITVELICGDYQGNEDLPFKECKNMAIMRARSYLDRRAIDVKITATS